LSKKSPGFFENRVYTVFILTKACPLGVYMAKPEFFSAAEQSQAPGINLHLHRWYLCRDLLAVCFYTLLAHCWPSSSVEAMAYKGHAELCQEQATLRKRQLAGEGIESAALSRTRFAR
jgi:hypothetical protein